MADDTTKNAAEIAIAALGGLTGISALAVFVRGLFTGTAGQDKETRDGLTAENARLRTEQTKLQGEVDVLRASIEQLTTSRLNLISSRAEARAVLREAERELTRPVTVWPPDPL